jgi:16S rRNA (cytosine1402-N4)-methyltransferase
VNHDVTRYHIPVLLDKSVELLISDSKGVYIDGTLGGGGHSREILRRITPEGRVFGFDQDADAVSYARAEFHDDSRMTVVHSNVVHLHSVLTQYHIYAISGMLLDLGVSSRQIENDARGFSFQHNGPLDMRMDVRTDINAGDLLQTSSRDELATIFFSFGEERHSRRIADAIVRARELREIRTTAELREIIESCVGGPHRNKTLARIFQALRIAVNDELGVLRETLEDAFKMLAITGRLSVVSYHSLEDKIVKSFFSEKSAHCICPPGLPVCLCGKVSQLRLLTKKSIKPDENEIRRNPRARSARLRAGEKIHA